MRKYLTVYNIWVIALVIIGVMDAICQKSGYGEVHRFLCIAMSFFAVIFIFFQLVYIIKCVKEIHETKNCERG